MTTAQLQASLRPWQTRLTYRHKRWRYWVRKEDLAAHAAFKAKDDKTKRAHERTRSRAHQHRVKWSRNYTEARDMINRRRKQIAAREADLWAGSRTITNEVIRIVGRDAAVSSRKRWELFGNPGSDHYRGNKTADAVDFATANNHDLKNRISRRLGGPAQLADYGSFNVRRNGHLYRVQIIAGTHGTGPHLHVGVKKVS